MVFFRHVIESFHFCETLQMIYTKTVQSNTVLKYKGRGKLEGERKGTVLYFLGYLVLYKITHQDRVLTR